MVNEARRQQLGRFLRQCRERLDPADFGFATAGRRRVRGLRREEISSLSGVGLTWYTWLEQGRDIRVSRAVLRALATSLKLSAAERRFMFSLVDESAEQPVPAGPSVPGELRQILARWDPLPAIVTNYRSDILACNAAGAEVYGPVLAFAPACRNIMRFYFLCPEAGSLYPEWAEEAPPIVARFRFEVSGRLDGDESLRELVDELSQASPVFFSLWNSTAVRQREHGRRKFHHRKLGMLALEHTHLTVSNHPGLTLVLFTPAPETDALEKLRRLAADGAATRPAAVRSPRPRPGAAKR
jgi:transcriptional regulator with XRE-family HTH domain